MKTNKIIIGLVGEIASGKGTVAKYLEEKHHATSHRFSTPLRDVLKRLHMEINRKNMQDISTLLREYFGQNMLAKVISEDVQKDENQIMVVDGIRRLADIEYLKSLPEFKLIYITADIKTRYERLIKRGENEDDLSKTFEQFQLDHQKETELEIPLVAEQANIKIDNSNGLDKLYDQIEKLLN